MAVWRRIAMSLWPRDGWRRVLVALVAVLIPVELIDRAAPPPVEKAKDASVVVKDHRGAPLRVFPASGGVWRIPADIDQLDPDFIKALLAYEDERFLEHGGVDLTALMRAVSTSVHAGRIVSGGSTITMQTARLLEPRPRTIGSKLIEMFRAYQLEHRLSKREILQLYLTLAPYGGNLEGVRAASFAYFGREPDNLAPDEIAMLIALPQSPEARRPDLRPAAAVRARARVLDRLAAKGVFARDLAEASSADPPPTRRDFPAIAWHAADAVRGMSANRDSDVVSTIDIALQKEVEAIARRAVAVQTDGAQTAIIVVETASRKVRAAAGSADLDRPGGWLDLTNRPRSPGSTLKPFIYGLAFDDGVAAPRTRISDAPRQFASYRPNNFDRTFRGDVTIAEALQHSLNVPAVAALDSVGAKRFVAALAFAGAAVSTPLTAEDDTGLAIALGGAGMTLRDLAALYAALGDGGQARPLIWVDSKPGNSPPPKTSQLMSAESAREIVDILSRAPAPEGRMPARLTVGAPNIAFKTGTSYGYRDAWAAGVSRAFTVVVWVGRADGAPRPGITGRDVALPILFEAFDAAERVRPARGSAPELVEPDSSDFEVSGSLHEFDHRSAPPNVLFPPDGSEIWSDDEHSAFVLAADGVRPLAWYAEGAPVPLNAAGDPVWSPRLPGFYALSVVDAEGRTTSTRVRVRTPEG
ncbi:penicillin-binding protein 1C [bacterium]|nr:penicillin-binding protein 1C [bacterium]